MIRKILCLSISALLLFSPNTFAATDTNPYGSSAVDPAGPNEIILTVNKGAKKQTFTYAQLSALKKSFISIYEPFVKKRQRFTVISLKTLFASVGINGKDKVSTIALNDYIFNGSADKFLRASGYLAIERDKKPIPYDQGGPIRLIYPDSSSWAKYLDAWNWSLSKIVVK